MTTSRLSMPNSFVCPLELQGVTKATKDSSAGVGGRGFALQDIHAPVMTCLDTIADLKSYVQHVPSVKKVRPQIVSLSIY